MPINCNIIKNYVIPYFFKFWMETGIINFSGSLCSYCWNGPPYSKLVRCGQCKRVWYCSKDCQKNDWSKHRAICPHLKSYPFLDRQEIENYSCWEDVFNFYRSLVTNTPLTHLICPILLKQRHCCICNITDNEKVILSPCDKCHQIYYCPTHNCKPKNLLQNDNLFTTITKRHRIYVTPRTIL